MGLINVTCTCKSKCDFLKYIFWHNHIFHIRLNQAVSCSCSIFNKFTSCITSGANWSIIYQTNETPSVWRNDINRFGDFEDHNLNAFLYTSTACQPAQHNIQGRPLVTDYSNCTWTNIKTSVFSEVFAVVKVRQLWPQWVTFHVIYNVHSVQNKDWHATCALHHFGLQCEYYIQQSLDEWINL